jgi:hypothetical protein
MLQTSEIRGQIIQELTGRLSLEDFEDWLAQRSWNMHLDSPREAQELAADIQLRLAEFSLGHLPETELREDFKKFVSNFVVHAGDILMPTSTSNSTPILIEPRWGTQPAGIQFAAVAA